MTSPRSTHHLARRSRWGALAVTGALVLAACGGGSADDAAPADTAPADSELVVTEPVEPVDTEPETEPDAEPETAVSTTEPESDPETEPDTTDATETTVAEPIGPRTIEHEYGTTEVPAAPERIVALSEEFLLADLLALGITPVASSSNEPDSFGGMDPALTEGIEIMTSATFNVELLATFRPDLIVAYPVYIELVGYDTLNAVAPTVAIGDAESDWRERLELTAEVLGVEAIAAERIAEYQAEHDAAAEVLDGLQMSIASIFDPSFIRAYTNDQTFLTQVMADAGVEFVPSDTEIDGVDSVGRVQLSLEQLSVLQGDIVVLLQRIGLEDAGAAEITSSGLWATLPAAQNDAVITLDRLGYPGAAGAAAFATDLAAAVEALS